MKSLLFAAVASALVGANSLRDALTTKLLDIQDTNLANYGSQIHVDARESAARAEIEFQGAGSKPGLEMWRVENTRNAETDVPVFGVKRWQQQGTFYSGDSYLVLNTYQAAGESNKLMFDLHYWLGTTSSVDEIGVAAYKTVELDDFLKGQAVQHRELQGFESNLFLSYFPNGIVYLDGGVASGFRDVKPEEYEPRLFQIRKEGNTVQAFEVLPEFKSLNQGDAFVLDNGLTVYVFEGKDASPFEKSKASIIAYNLAAGRFGKSKTSYDLDDAFWKALGGGKADLVPETANVQQVDVPVQLYRLSDETGVLKFTKVAQNAPISASLLTAEDIFVLDAGLQIVVWVGSKASWWEKSQAMAFVTKYQKSASRPLTLPVTVINQGQPNALFSDLVK